MRLLITRVGALGDVLHALPAVAALKRARPDTEVGWCVDPRWVPLLAAMDTNQRGPYVDLVHLAPTKQWKSEPLSITTARSFAALGREMRSQQYDLAVDMQGTLRSAVLGRAAVGMGGKLAGYADPREPLAKFFYTQKLQRHGTHVVEQGAALLSEACATPLMPGRVELPREAWAEDWAAELVGSQRVCLLSAGGGWAAKQWPAERYGELARALQQRGFTVMVNAARKDDEIPARVVAASEGAAHAVVCNVAGLIALVRRAALVIGGDTGPVHMAAALEVPVAAIFGPTDPARNGPWGFGPRVVVRDAASVTSYKKSAVLDPGLARITPGDVLTAVQSVGAV